MKKSWSLIALAVAMAATAASAQTATPTTTATPATTPANTATTAGTEIKNQAEITFTPENGTETTIPSNPVTTTVLPVPSFAITPNDGSSDATKPDYTKPGQTATVKPCDKNVSFPYTLTNTGNVEKETYTLTNTPDPTGAVKTPDNIRFYPASADTNNDGKLSADEVSKSSPITSIGPVGKGESVKFFQVYDIPCTATDKDVFGGDPTGNRNPQSDSKLNPTTPVPQDGNNSNTSTVSRNDGVVIGPKQDPDGNGNPTTPPYQSPEGVTITPSTSDTQVAQATATTTTITFTNTVQNTGNRPDVLNISQTTAGFPAGTTVVLLDPKTGQPLTDSNGDGKPDVGTVQPGGTADVLVKVTFPAGSQPTAGTIPTITVVVTSSNDPTKSDPTKDIVNLPGVVFGNPDPANPSGPANPGTIGTPPAGSTAEFPNGSGNPSNPILPPATCTAPIRTYISMKVDNIGSAPDTYDVTGTAPVKLADGSTQEVKVIYYKDVNGDGKLDAGDTALTDTNGNGTPDTGAIDGGKSLKLVAVVDVPCAAAAQTITLKQEIKSPTTGTKGEDNNDTITVGTSGKPSVVKSVDKTTAKPGEELTYTIIGKNSSNANVTKALVCDTIPANTSFSGANISTDIGGKLLYQIDGGAWTSDVNAAGASIKNGTATAKGSKICVAVDTNNDNNITTADIMKPGQGITFILKVKVN